MNLLAIDPGKKNIAFAYFDEQQILVDCDYVEFENLFELRERFWSFSNFVVIVEVPQVYKLGLSKGDPADLIDVALAAGTCLSLSKVSLGVKPHEWKASLDKKVHHARLLQEAPQEAVRMFEKVRKSKRHNVLDAFGIGLWFIRRNVK